MSQDPQSQGFNPRFDLDLKFGQQGERWLLWLAQPDAKVEVKTERDTWRTTGNICFEYECRGKPSGVATTQSDYWVHLLTLDGVSFGGYIWPTTYLKQWLRKVWTRPIFYGARIVAGGDDNASLMLLVPISQLHLIPIAHLPNA